MEIVYSHRRQKYSFFVRPARLLSKVNSEHGADEAWRSLIQHNPDNHEYYRGLLKSKNIDLGRPPHLFHPT